MSESGDSRSGVRHASATGFLIICQINDLRYDILTAITEIDGFVAGKSRADLMSDRALQLVLEREFEIIGEALFRLRRDAPDAFATIPSGNRIIAMRNILAHGYDRVDYAILWDAATLELNALRYVVEALREHNAS